MRLKLLGLVVLLSGLSGCSTTEKPSHRVKTPTEKQQQLPAQPETAEVLYQQTRLMAPVMRTPLLLQAREQAIAEQSWTVLAQICRDLHALGQSDRVDNQLFFALSQLQLNNTKNAFEALAGLEQKLNTENQRLWYAYLLGSLYATQHLHHQAANELLKASALGASLSAPLSDLNQRLWRTLGFLPSNQLDALNRGDKVQRGWINLARYLLIYLGSPNDLSSAFKGWRLSYPNHPATALLNENQDDWLSVESKQINTLAVLLPMSGDNRALGEAVKTGILAALDSHHVARTLFIDAMLSPEQINQKLAEAKPDFIIGPLLKPNIEKLDEAKTLLNYPVIYLNRVEYQRSSEQHFYFALAPEHELDQALTHFLAAGYEKPMLLAPNTRAGKRLVEYFTHNWNKYNEVEPEVGLFNDKQDMQKTVMSLLEVDKSKQRIADIDTIFKRNVESETRSRRDIDVIYLIGDAIQTRLLKPYLDVNVSTFVERIPLYASSRSHSLKIDKTDKRDLAGLYFTESPWMLPDNPDSRALRNRYDSLWGEQSDLPQRLFAMGHDAVLLMPHISQMARIAGKQSKGLSGLLSLSEQGQIIRQLRWGQYNSRSIRQVNLKDKAAMPRYVQQLLTPPEQRDLR